LPVRPSHLAAFVAAVLILNVPRSVLADTAMVAATVDSSASASSPTPGPVGTTPSGGPVGTAPAVIPSTALATAQAGYQAAWAQRHAGEFDAAVRSAEQAMAVIDDALTPDVDATTRRSLVDLRSQLSGLRDAARKEAQSQSSAVASGNEADDKVLNTPAAEEITPQFNADVYRYIEYFTGAGRSVFERWLKRSGRYMDLFRGVLQKEGLPPDLVHLVFVESGFNVNARSMSAAVGPWQFLGGTARVFGLTVNKWVDERKDPEKSTVAAARYLKHLYSIFGDWPLALASYNAGEGTVLRAIKTQGTTNYWDLRLPAQTEDYVPQFMAVLAIAHDPGKYGFDSVALDDPMEFDQIAFKGAVDLHVVAKLAGCTYDELRELNPAVLRSAATGREGVTTLRVPPGKGPVLLQKMQEGAPLPSVNLTLSHRVRSHETISSIASQYGVSARQLALANGIGRKRPLRRGMVLTVPASLASPHPQLVDASDPRASTAYVPARTLRPLAQLNGTSSADGRQNVVVHRGQTLASIAADHGCTVDDLKRWNHLTASTVRRGTRLKVRTGDSVAEQPAALDSASAAQLAGLKLRPARHHGHHRGGRGGSGRRMTAAPGGSIVVRSGESLDTIARRHGVSVVQLKRENGIAGSGIRAGQRLRIPNS
jgi:membrane-bound lytic murein transglycosylase D